MVGAADPFYSPHPGEKYNARFYRIGKNPVAPLGKDSKYSATD